MEKQQQQQAKKSPLKVCLAPAIYRSVTPQTHSSLLFEVAACLNNQQLRDSIELEYAAFGNDAMICRSRSLSASLFLQHPRKLDVLVWVDADMRWQVNDVIRIATKAHERQAIVGGVVSKRGFGLGIACRLKCGQRPIQTGTDELVPCSYVGAAFMAIPRSALEKIAPTLPTCHMGPQSFIPFCMPMVAPNDQTPGLVDYLSEDWALCRRAIDAGVDIFVDLKPIITHVGEHEYSIDDAFCTYADSAYVLCTESNFQRARELEKRLNGLGINRTMIIAGDLTKNMLAAEGTWRERSIFLNGDAEITDNQLYAILSKGKFGFFGYSMDEANPELFGGGIGRDSWRLIGTLKMALERIGDSKIDSVSETFFAWYRAAAGSPHNSRELNRRLPFWSELGQDSSTTKPCVRAEVA